MLLPVLFLCHDTLTSKTFDVKYQQTAMLRVLGVYDSPDVQTALRHKLSQSHVEINNPCEWRGVQCKGPVVTKIYFQMDPEMAAYEWIPPTIQDLNVSDQRFRRAVDTRLLPRALSRCVLRRCAIKGTFKAEALPKNLQSLDSSQNAIRGAILLANLPHKIQFMNLSENAISHVLVDNGTLPRSLEMCSFMGMQSIKIKAIDGRPLPRCIMRDLTLVEEFKIVRNQKS